jgi:hypothetical protein
MIHIISADSESISMFITLTVYESILFAASLKLRESTPIPFIKQRVLDFIINDRFNSILLEMKVYKGISSGGIL